MIKVVVDRKKWYRGKGSDSSGLLLNNGKMCCIGFLARRLGCKPREIRDRPTLMMVDRLAVTLLLDKYRDIIDDAYQTNDDQEIDDKARERELKVYGKEMGVNFVFKN